MTREKKKIERYMEVYEAMKNAVPDDSNMLEVIRAAELIIADCIAQTYAVKEIEEKTYKAIADDIQELTEVLKPIFKEMKEEEL